MNEMDLRRATLDDLDALIPLVSGYREFYQQRPDPAKERELMAAHLRDERSVVFIASHQGRPIGFAQLFRYWSTVHLKPTLILEDLFVAPEARGSGAASRLLAHACAYARDLGVSSMFLETAHDNLKAQSVYERNGWTREQHFLKFNAPSE